MYFQKRQNLLKKIIFFLPLILVLPFVVIFDTLVYFITRPACLNCGNLVEFLKSASLSVFLLGGVIGYKFKKK